MDTFTVSATAQLGVRRTGINEDIEDAKNEMKDKLAILFQQFQLDAARLGLTVRIEPGRMFAYYGVQK